MAPKRKGDESQTQQLTGRDKKKQKLASARTIQVQPMPGPSTSGNTQSTNATAGPSKSVRFEGAKTLPGSLDVERFAEARAFEINAMHKAMLSARDNATHRAWQQLPRHLRRRAASHDVRRVPVRLREKAKSEMDPVDKKKKKKLPKRGRNSRPSRTDTFLARQLDKAWLETHLWHAKRMHMKDMWGYRLAIQPTEKSFRPSHRAAVHGSILHDASYFGFIELKGPEDVLRMVLESCCDASGPSPGAKRFVAGSRAFDTHFYKRGAYPLDLLAPVTIIWQPVTNSTTQISGPSEVVGASAPGSSKGRKRKGKSKEKADAVLSSPPTRLVWIKVHPSVFHEVYIELRDATSFTLEKVKKSAQDGEPEVIVEMADLRKRLNVFEIMGPKSSQVIKGALKPVLEDKREEFKKFWNVLGDLQTTGSLPRNMVIGMEVYDPRLNFPPKNAKVHVDTNNPSPSLSTASVFPTSVLAQCKIWDDEIRHLLTKPRYKKKDIDDRKSKNVIPGTPLQAGREDNRVPILLIQRSVEPLTNEMTGTRSPALHGWTLIVPACWSMPFFSSLTYTGTRVGGQRERATQYFEACRPNYPTDYPATDAYDDYAEQREDEEKSRWERKPPAKRVNYSKMGIRSPWRADWEVLLGLVDPEEQNLDAMDESEDLLPAQREEASEPQEVSNDSRQTKLTSRYNDEFPDPNRPRAWLLQGPAVKPALDAAESSLICSTGLVHYLNSLRAKRGLESLDFSQKAEDIWKTALVMVKIRMCGRGKPEDLAVLYQLTDDEWRDARSVDQKSSGVSLEDDDEEDNSSEAIPPDTSIIGYVTAGNASLSLGKGLAIGCLPLFQLFSIKQQAKRLGQGDSLLVKTRNRDGVVCRAAYLDVMDC